MLNVFLTEIAIIIEIARYIKKNTICASGASNLPVYKSLSTYSFVISLFFLFIIS